MLNTRPVDLFLRSDITGCSVVKNLPAMQETWFNPCIGRIPWRRKPTPVFLPGKSHGPRSLGGCGPWGCKELDPT